MPRAALSCQWVGSGALRMSEQEEVLAGEGPDGQDADHGHIGRSHWPLIRLGSGKSCMAVAAVVGLGQGLQAWSRTHHREPGIMLQAGLGVLSPQQDSIRTWRGAGLVDLLTDHTISGEGRNCAGYQRGSARCEGGDER